MWRAGLDDSHLEMLHELAAISRDLSTGGVWVVSADNERPASFPAQAELVSVIDDVDRVRSNVEPDALHHSNSVNPHIQRAIECGRSLGLVVRHLGPQSAFSENLRILF